MTVQLLLCTKHAIEVAANLKAPTAGCTPKPQWFGTGGIIQECEARSGPTPKILEYLLQEAQERQKGLP